MVDGNDGSTASTVDLGMQVPFVDAFCLSPSFLLWSVVCCLIFVGMISFLSLELCLLARLELDEGGGTGSKVQACLSWRDQKWAGVTFLQ